MILEMVNKVVSIFKAKKTLTCCRCFLVDKSGDVLAYKDYTDEEKNISHLITKVGNLFILPQHRYSSCHQ